MNIIDFHAHYLPPEALPAGAIERNGDVVTLKFWGEHIDRVDATIIDMDLQRRALSGSMVDTRVLSLPPFALGDNFSGDEAVAFCRTANKCLRDATADAGKEFLGLATVPLRDPRKAVVVLREAAGEYGLRGVEICSYGGAFELDDEALEVFWTAVEALDLPVMIHPHRVAGADRMAPYYLRNLVGNPTETAVAASRLVFGGVLARHPRLKILLSHGGGAFPFIIGRLQHGADVRPESTTPLRPWDTLSRFYVDTVVFDPKILQALLSLVPVGQVVLGSDTPFSMSDPDPVGTVEAAVQSPAERQAICSETAGRLLKIGEKR